MPEPQEVEQILGLHNAVAVQIRTSCVSAPSVVNVGHGVEIDRSVVGATREHANAAVVIGSLWLVVQRLGISAMLGPAMGIGDWVLGHHVGKHFAQTSER